MTARWEEVARRYTPPVTSLKAVGTDRMDRKGKEKLAMMERLAFGFTAIEFRHRRTGKVRFEYATGDQTASPTQ